MASGTRHIWTAEELERVVAAVGTKGHMEVADELELSVNTIYSTRQRVRMAGGIEQFLEHQGVSAPYKSRNPETLEEQLGHLYLIRVASSGRNGSQAQYTVTIPSALGHRFVAEYGRQVRFVPLEDGIKIIPVPTLPAPELPAWLGGDS